MKRFLKVSVLLVTSLFLVVSGVNTGLDRLSHSPTQSNFTQYDEKGTPVLSYTGDLSQMTPSLKRAFVTEFHYIHRS